MSTLQYIDVHEETDNGWSAYVPNLPDCIAAEVTRSEVEDLIREAIELYVEAWRWSNEPVPTPGRWSGLVDLRG